MAERTPDEKLDALAQIDREGRVGRTVVQVTIPTAIVGIGTWLCAMLGVDLDPGAGTDLPAEQVGYFIAVVTGLIAWVMNRRPGSDERGDSFLTFLYAVALILVIVALLMWIAEH